MQRRWIAKASVWLDKRRTEITVSQRTTPRNAITEKYTDEQQELLVEALRVLQLSVIGFDLNFQHFEGTLEAVYDGFATADLAGPTRTDEFTNEVIRRVRTKVEVWSSLG